MENGGFINASVDTFQTASLAQSWNHCVFCCRFCTCCKWGTEGFPVVVSAAPYSTSTTEAHRQPPPTANKEHLQHAQHLFGDCFSMFFRLSFFNVSEMKLKWYMNYQSDVRIYIIIYLIFMPFLDAFGHFLKALRYPICGKIRCIWSRATRSHSVSACKASQRRSKSSAYHWMRHHKEASHHNFCIKRSNINRFFSDT